MHSRFFLISTFLLAACTGNANGTALPLPYAEDRPRLLYFGLYVTPEPENNPINPPERFTGYHAATDFEILPGEDAVDIPVYAICTGPIQYSGFAEGYGGLITQYCTIDDQDVTALYGHLAVDSLAKKGKNVSAGDMIGILGTARSTDTDNNRKHLHLGLLKGHVSSVQGYVQTPAELDMYLDPEKVLGL